MTLKEKFISSNKVYFMGYWSTFIILGISFVALLFMDLFVISGAMFVIFTIIWLVTIISFFVMIAIFGTMDVMRMNVVNQYYRETNDKEIEKINTVFNGLFNYDTNTNTPT